MTYTSGPLHLDVQSAQRSRRMVRASCAVSANLPSRFEAVGAGLANAASIARMTLRHFFPGLGSAATANVWNIQNTFLLCSCTMATPTLYLSAGFHRLYRIAIRCGLPVVLNLGFSPLARAIRK